MLTTGSLCSGIGLLDLAVELTLKSELQFQCEIDPWRQRVLRKHFPGVLLADDITKFSPPSVDLLFGGFPCQDVSGAGKKLGLHGERSGLWYHFYRIIRATHPGCVFIENVSGLSERGLDEVLEDLQGADFNTRYGLLGAHHVGYPHRRKRWWILAYSSESRLQALREAHYSNWPEQWREHIVRRGANVETPPFFNHNQPLDFKYQPGVFRASDDGSTRLDRCRLAGLGDSVHIGTAIGALTGLLFSGV